MGKDGNKMKKKKERKNGKEEQSKLLANLPNFCSICFFVVLNVLFFSFVLSQRVYNIRQK